jgi:CheY-like chemotaxis protein
LVRTLLDREGCLTTLVTRLSEAREQLAGQDFDLVLLDLELPDGTALDLLADRPVADTPWPPIVALTANALPETRQRCLDAGMEDYLSKPFTQEDFLAILNKWRNRVLPK